MKPSSRGAFALSTLDPFLKWPFSRKALETSKSFAREAESSAAGANAFTGVQASHGLASEGKYPGEEQLAWQMGSGSRLVVRCIAACAK